MFRKILYPTDFSKHAEKALDCVKQLKGAGAEEAIVLHVLDERDTAHATPPEAKFFLELEREMRGGAEELKRELEKKGFKAKAIVTKGVPADEILKTARKEKVDLIVIGSAGKGMLQEAILGSTTEGVIRNSKGSVLVVKP